LTERDDLPLPDYDHLQVGSLTSRIRTLASDDVQTLLAYERSHANRIQVVSAMEHRLSGGDPTATGADAPPAAAGSSQVSEATSGPPVNPPSHGDPTNPAQPRSTG